jgi:hypothetical protein
MEKTTTTMPFLQSMVLDMAEEPVLLENALKIVILTFSLVLLALTISAYRKTGLNKILYAAIAFGLFAFHASFDFLADNVKFFEALQSEIDVLLLVIMLAILTLFFIAIVKRK